jgi:dCMP deaminase
MPMISKAIDGVFQEVGDFILIGLTGRTGSGCTSTASRLASEKIDPPGKSAIYDSRNEQIKYKIISKFIRDKNNWTPFECIRVTTVITAFILEMDYDDFVDFVSTNLNEELEEARNHLDCIKREYEEYHLKVLNCSLSKDIEKLKECKNDVFELYLAKDKPGSITDFTHKLKESLNRISGDAYIKLFQIAGDNIRASGKAKEDNFYKENIFLLPEAINKLVKVIREIKRENKDNTRIAIDAIRNPFEALFFKQRYASFYMISVNADNLDRKKRIKDKLNNISEDKLDDTIKEIDEKEYPDKLDGKKIFVSQNIQKCIEMSDIHIHNPNREKHCGDELCAQLAWYVTLILHPGLVSPTAIERNMQFALHCQTQFRLHFETSGCGSH